MLLVIDNFDSFTFNLAHYFEMLGQEIVVCRNDQIPPARLFKECQGIVLSPGPMLPEDAGFLMEIIKKGQNKPILGICLGHQALIMHHGGALKQVIPFHGKASEIIVEKNSIFDGLPTKFNVVRYHSWVAGKTPDNCIALANTVDGLMMAFRHQVYPHWGIQFHPESVLTQYGIEILENWLIFNQISKPKKMFD